MEIFLSFTHKWSRETERERERERELTHPQDSEPEERERDCEAEREDSHCLQNPFLFLGLLSSASLRLQLTDVLTLIKRVQAAYDVRERPS